MLGSLRLTQPTTLSGFMWERHLAANIEASRTSNGGKMPLPQRAWQKCLNLKGALREKESLAMHAPVKNSATIAVTTAATTVTTAATTTAQAPAEHMFSRVTHMYTA